MILINLHYQNPSFTWTEDFQVDYLYENFHVFDEMRATAPYFMGEMIWNFADFATLEGLIHSVIPGKL